MIAGVAAAIDASRRHATPAKAKAAAGKAVGALVVSQGVCF